jgi:RNA polymerase sigma-70 factor (ECF subfamily)
VAQPTPDPETALMGRVVRGDEQALAALYDRMAPLAYGLALRMSNDPVLAQDAVQEAFLRVWRRASGFDPARGRARAWLLRIVRNATIDQLRSRDALGRSELRALEEPGNEPPPGPDEQAMRSQRAGALRGALAQLSDDQRRVIEIAYFQGLSHSEIAERENLPLGTVKTRIRDGVIRLRRMAVEGMLDDGS